AADRFVVIVSSDKLVDRISPPVPLELLEYGLAATLRRLGSVSLRDVPRSPDGGVIADYTGDVDDPEELAGRLSAMVCDSDPGLLPPALVSEAAVARGDAVEIRPVGWLHVAGGCLARNAELALRLHPGTGDRRVACP